MSGQSLKQSRRTLSPAAIILLLALAGILDACRPDPPEYIPLPTRICVRTQHHGQLVPHTTVYLKYNTDTFPGYDKPPSFFDDSFETGADARGCIGPVPEGRHWLVAFGYDSLHQPPQVFGSLPVEISLGSRAVLDTILYVSE